jgi:hypothetical protein
VTDLGVWHVPNGHEAAVERQKPLGHQVHALGTAAKAIVVGGGGRTGVAAAAANFSEHAQPQQALARRVGDKLQHLFVFGITGRGRGRAFKTHVSGRAPHDPKACNDKKSREKDLKKITVCQRAEKGGERTALNLGVPQDVDVWVVQHARGHGFGRAELAAPMDHRHLVEHTPQRAIATPQRKEIKK